MLCHCAPSISLSTQLVENPQLHQSAAPQVVSSQLHLHQLAQTVGGSEPHHVMIPLDVRTNTAAAIVTQQTGAGLDFFIGDGIQPVPALVAEWIWTGEFIEMVDLLRSILLSLTTMQHVLRVLHFVGGWVGVVWMRDIHAALMPLRTPGQFTSMQDGNCTLSFKFDSNFTYMLVVI